MENNCLAVYLSIFASLQVFCMGENARLFL